MTKGEDMVQNREVNVNWLRINVPSIAAIVAATVTLTMYIQSLEGRLDTIEKSRQERSVVSDKKFDDIQRQLKPLDNVVFRLDQQDKRDDAQDIRIDRLLDLMGAKYDALSKDVGDLKADLAGVKADVRVVAQDVKNLSAKSQPTTFRSP